MEARTLKTNTIAITTKFLYKCKLTKFGCPLTIDIDQGVHSINDAIKYLTNHFLLKHVHLTTYYPQGNGQVKSTLKVLGSLLTKLVSENKTNSDEHTSTMLFSYIITYKVTTRYTPYQLLFGLHILMPIKYIVPIIGGNEGENPLMIILISRITKLEKLQEARIQATKTIRIQEWNITLWNQQKNLKKQFNFGDYVH